MNASTIKLTRQYLQRDGRPWLPMMGEFHYSRYPCAYWDKELVKIKAGGVEIVATYVIWIHHEEQRGKFVWSGDRDLRRFVRLCAEHGLYVWLRVGPFAHGEVRNGGLPDWLYDQPFEARSNDPRYLALAGQWYQQIGRQVRGRMLQDGGPIIGVQLENEFMASAAPWETTHNPGMELTPKGSGGIAHLHALKRRARAAGLRVPVYSCTGWGGAPVDEGEFLPVYGGYAFYAWLDDPSQQQPTDNYLFRRPRYEQRRALLAHGELGGGMQPFYRNRPIVPPQSVEAMAIVKLGSGANLLGFYMYHGGSNPSGKHSFLNEHRCPRISYDFQAPLGEYGQRREHYWRLRRLGLFLQSFGDRLAPMQTVLPPGAERIKPTDTQTPRWAMRSTTGDGAGFVFLNNYQDHVAMRDHRDVVIKAEGVTFPPLTLRRGVAAILPFNLDLDGVLLKCATAQPLTCFHRGPTAHYIFFTPPGMRAKYIFEPATFTRRKQTKDGLLLTGRNGQRVLITTLTDQQSRAAPATQSKTVRLSVRQVAAGKWIVPLPRRLSGPGRQVLLRIQYFGDTGAAYLDGRLVADNFSNGTPWEIGLERFAPHVLAGGLMLLITPPRDADQAKVTYTDKAAMKQAGAQTARLRWVRALVERTRRRDDNDRLAVHGSSSGGGVWDRGVRHRHGLKRHRFLARLGVGSVLAHPGGCAARDPGGGDHRLVDHRRGP
ncbi:MAG: beta-galactosidase [Phycisphaeraceae bacterium]